MMNNKILILLLFIVMSSCSVLRFKCYKYSLESVNEVVIDPNTGAYEIPWGEEFRLDYKLLKVTDDSLQLIVFNTMMEPIQPVPANLYAVSIKDENYSSLEFHHDFGETDSNGVLKFHNSQLADVDYLAISQIGYYRKLAKVICLSSWFHK